MAVVAAGVVLIKHASTIECAATNVACAAPGGHLWHTREAVMLEYVPFGHGRQTTLFLAPTVFDAVPNGHP